MSKYKVLGVGGGGAQGNKSPLLDTMWVDICHHTSAQAYEALTPRINSTVHLGWWGQW